MKRILLTLSLVAYFAIALGQTDTKEFIIGSKILDAETKKPLIYAAVYNLQSRFGTATDLKGYFKLQKNRIGDSIRISHLGYNDTVIVCEAQFTRAILLRQNSIKIDEVTVLADDDYLYDLLHGIRKKYLRRNAITSDGMAKSAKTYYLLESFHKNHRVELTEAFFNGYYGDYDLKNLKIKKGRTGAKPVRSIFYISSETSKAFYKHELLLKVIFSLLIHYNFQKTN